MIAKNDNLTGNGQKQAELVMQTSMQLLPLIMNNIPQAVFWKDRDLVYLGCNQAFAEDAGFSSPEEIIGKTDFDMPWTDQAELYRADDRLVMEKGEPKLNYEEPQTSPNGSTIWLSTSKVPVYENGQVVAVLAMYEDITARKQAEKDFLLRDRALASSLNAVVILNLQDSKPIYVNDAILKMTGYTREEVMQIGLADITGDPEEPRKIRAAIQSQGFFIGEELIKRKDGSVFPANFFSSLITNDKGQPIAVQSSFFDISERKQAEEAVRASEEQFHTLYDNAAIGLYRTTPDGRTLMINPAGLQMLGFDSFEEFSKRNLEESGFEQEDSRKKFREKIEREGVIDQESAWIRKDGSAIFVRESAKVFRGKNGEVLYYDGSFEDITERKTAEEAVRESEDRFRRFAEATVEGLVFHEQGRIVDVNPSAAKMFGLSNITELIGRNLLEFIVPECHQLVIKQMQLESVLPYEIQGIRKDGSAFPIETSTRAYKVGDRTIRASSIRDITDRKQAEAQLRQSEANLSSALRVANMGHWEFDIPTQMFTFNDQYYSLHGTTAQEVGGYQMSVQRFAQEFVHPEDGAIVGQATQQAIETTDPNFQVQIEARILRKDGQSLWVTVWFRVEKDEQGHTVKLHGVNQDITERKQAEADILREKNVSDATINSLPGIFYMFDTQGNLIRRNKNYETVVGYSAEEVASRNALDAIAEEDRERAAQAIQRAFTEGKVELEVLFTTRHGEKIPYFMTAVRMTIGDDMYVVGTGLDLSERKRLEQQIQEAFERRGYQVQIGTEISQEIAAASEIGDLFGRVVTLTKERLGYYHTQLLRYDAAQDAVVLINGYGEIGEKMLASGHKLPMGTGLIGTAAATGETVMRTKLTEDTDWKPNPLLPETKGEIAVPIKWKNTVLGVLDVQSDQADALSDEDRLLLEGLCGQIASAMYSAELVETVRQNEARLAEALKTARLANWEYDVEKDIFTFNDQFYSIFHTTVEKAGGYQISSARYAELFVHPDDMEVVGAEIGKALSSTERVYNTTIDHRIRYEDGGIGYITVQLTVERDENGKITRYYGANQDITERKQAETALRESEQRYQQILDALTDMVLVKGPKSSIVWANKSFCDYYGMTNEQLRDMIDAPIVEPDYTLQYVKDDAQVFESGEILQIPEEPVTRHDGLVRLFETVKSPIRDLNDNVIMTVGVSRDITERHKEQEAMAERLEEINRLNRIMSREGWKTYRETATVPTGFVFDQDGLKSVKDSGSAEELFANFALTVPGGETIGNLAIVDDPQSPLSPEDEVFLQQVSDQVALALESARLLEQTQLALYESKESQELTRNVIDSTDDWIFVKDRSHRYQLVNQGYANALHIPVEAFIGKNDLELGFPEELVKGNPEKGIRGFWTDDQQVLDSGMAQHYPDDPASIDGKIRIFDTIKIPLRDASNNVWGVLAFSRDLTERKQAEGLIAQRATQLEAVATVSTTASTVLDPDKLMQAVVDLTKERFNLYHTHIYLADESWNTLLLAAGAGEVGRQMVETGHAIEMDAEKSLVARAMRERNPIIVNDVRSEAGFLPNPMLPETRAEMAVPMIVGDKVIGVFDVQSETVGNFTDEDANIYTTLASQVAVALQNARLYVEQAATVTQLRELDRLKSSFLANMSHELRTPLNSILGFADVMLEELDGPLTENMQTDLGLIYKNGQHLLHLINDVLDMAKIESGKMNLNIEKFNIQETIEEVTSITSTLANDKNLKLYIEPDSDQDAEINADKIRLRQVMINLVNNAIKFTEKGEIAIRVTREESNVLISVKDTGMGIPMDQLESVFQEFTQVDTTTTRKAGGTGLGLPISRRLIEMHSGRLWVESSGVEGEGSTFYVFLPIEAKINEAQPKVK